MCLKKKTDNKTEKLFIVIHLCKDFQQKNVFYFGNKDFDMYVCMYVCMSICMSVYLYVRMLFPHSARTNGPIFKI